MELIVQPDGTARWGAKTMRCAVGRAGVAHNKCEGDGATPVGVFPIRFVLYRPDRLPVPTTWLPVEPIAPRDGWCDDPEDADYNRRVALPHRARCEYLWREDRVYDVIVVIGHNDAPVVKGAGSGIFLHVARENYVPTEGCVALYLDDLLKMLKEAAPGDAVRVIG